MVHKPELRDEGVMLDAASQCYSADPYFRRPPGRATPHETDEEDALILMNCLPFRDPAAGAHCGHIGTNPAILAGIAQSDYLDVFLQRFCEAVHSTQRRCPGGMIVVFLLCNSGKHRSVGMGWLLRELLSRSPRNQVYPTISWTCLPKLAGCRICEECDPSEVVRAREDSLLACVPQWNRCGGNRWGSD
jgi:hypothetical protein